VKSALLPRGQYFIQHKIAISPTNGAGGKAVTAEQMELAPLWVESIRLQRQVEILKTV
jgi:hypothetical protein